MITIAKVICTIWILSEVLLNRLMHSKEGDKKNADKNSMAIIWITISIATTAGVMLRGITNPSFGNDAIVRPLGLVLILLGIVFRLFAVRSLGKMFTVDVTIRKDHALHTSGMYKYIRHPSYTFSLLSFIGLGFSINNVLSFFIITIPIFLTFVYRANVEEKVLTEAFGKAYIDYKKNSYRFFPFIY